MDKILQNIRQIKIEALDIGARGAVPDTWNDTLIPIKATRFDMQECNVYTSSNKLISEKYLPIILSGKSGKRKMHILKGESGSSLYKPNQKWRKFWVEGYSEVNRIEEVDTRAIEDLNLARFHMIKADIQGAELEVFQGIAPEKWNDVIGVEVEASFWDSYEDICLFPDIHSYLESKGFVLIGLRPSYSFLMNGEGQIANHKKRYGNIEKHTFMGKTSQADCFYLKIWELEKYGISKIVRHLNICMMYRYPDGIELMRKSGNKRTDKKTLAGLCELFSSELEKNIKYKVAGIHCGPTGF